MTVNPNRIQKDYYEGNNYGDYQFTSLQDIVDQFLVVYVGEQKIINKASRVDVAFHAQRALQELSFDTFKSIKSQEIVLPPSLTMILPHDYVNYTNVSWSDNSGIQHTLYPVSKTSNPFKIKQDDQGNYDFGGNSGIFTNFNNSGFTTTLSATSDWAATRAKKNLVGSTTNPNGTATVDIFDSANGKLTATIHKETFTNGGGVTFTYGRHYSCWQAVDVSGLDEINLSGSGVAPVDVTGAAGATIRLGVSRTKGDSITNPHKDSNPSLNGDDTGREGKGPNFIPYIGSTTGKAYVEWVGGSAIDSGIKNLQSVDVRDYSEVFVLVTMFVPGDISGITNGSNITLTLDDVNLTFEGDYNNLQGGEDSTTWTNYKSLTPSENQNEYNYDTDNYDLIIGESYGLDPQHSQVNGSFYIDNLKGLINFSSNISGKTVILKYISDSLGTDNEMQVHKFAQEAMYKHIMYAILSTKANVPEYVVRRYKQEKFAATRQAKLRLSNIKLEEITQILRGKSKWIKH